MNQYQEIYMQHRLIDIIIHFAQNFEDSTTDLQDMTQVSNRLSELGYSTAEINAAVIWLMDKLKEDKIKSTILDFEPKKKYRILHEFEEMVIKPKAFGYIILMQELGLINAEETELIIEYAMQSFDKQVDEEEIKSIMASILFDPSKIGWRNHSLIMSSLFSETVH